MLYALQRTVSDILLQRKKHTKNSLKIHEM